VLRTLTGVERVLELGRVLGYPHCCVRAFAEYNDPAEARHRFHQQLIKLGLDKGSPIELWAVYHTPCSVNCSRTLTLGRGYLRAVEEFSSKVYRKVVEGLSGVHLTWSVGRRYLDYEILDSDVSREFSILASRVLGRGAMVRAVFVKRPYMYVDQVSESLVVRLTPAIMGLRYVAFRPGVGLLVLDPETYETLIRVTKGALEGRLDTRHLKTVFREYEVALER